MNTQRRALRAVILTLWSYVLTAATLFLGSAPLRALWRLVGWPGYILLTAASTLAFSLLGWTPLAIAYGSVALLIGVFSELEDLEQNYITAGLFAVLITSLSLGGLFALWVARLGSGWLEYLTETVNGLMKPALAGSVAVQIEVSDIVKQLPSAVVVLLGLSLFVALLMEKRILAWAELNQSKGRDLAEFRVPDFFIWPFILGLLFSFAKLDINWAHTLGLNILNVSLLLYFLQGLAVLVKLFRKMQMGVFWQTLIIAIAVLQLFLVLSAVGIMDYWLNFRQRMNPKPSEVEHEI